MRQYHVYIPSGASRTLYIGITNDPHRRLYEHQHKRPSGFTGKYNITRRVYYKDMKKPRTSRPPSPAKSNAKAGPTPKNAPASKPPTPAGWTAARAGAPPVRTPDNAVPPPPHLL
jgi:hypothetical protein